ncbi:MAG: alpha/beta hydrolase [Coxiellaceae bacterium]|nr:MAG: alpha/beta hydrolase [Coxiellaceae bacterium]
MATDQFDGKNHWERFTPVITGSWQGDPVSALDYIAAVTMAKYPARIFAKLIQQQLEAGIQVNIIAHSLGSLVVLNILQLLAEAGLCVEHTFLWQSAVPNTIFSTTPPVREYDRLHYYLPLAHQGSKQFTVLYSNTDDVLGPVLDGSYQQFKDDF